MNIGLWNVHIFLSNGIEGPENARFLKLEQEFQRYKLDILDLSKVRW